METPPSPRSTCEATHRSVAPLLLLGRSSTREFEGCSFAMGGVCCKKTAVSTVPLHSTNAQILPGDSQLDQLRNAPSESVVATDAEEADLAESRSQKPESNRSWQAGSGGKVSEMSSRLSRAGSFGLGKAVEVLDSLGSSMTNLNANGGFSSGVGSRGTKISILAFEVANTIVKGVNLMLSVSEENIEHLKQVVLPSEAVFQLVSKDKEELLMLVAAEKREELKVFSREVVRFGNRCKDPQWHNLDRYFDKLGSKVVHQKLMNTGKQEVVQQLMDYVQFTAELYHELQVMYRFEQEFRRKQEKVGSSSAVQNGNDLQIARHDLKSQKKYIKGLMKRSLWDKILDEVMEKLVDVVHILHLEIHRAFSGGRDNPPTKVFSKNERLGPAGLALHYANIINQIDTIAARSHSVPSSARDALYQALPPRIKSALPTRLQTIKHEQQFAVLQIKADMDKTMSWLLPVASNTTKAHHGFGWIGEWANTGSESNKGLAGQSNFIRLETLFHADKEITEAYILDLLVLLHHLIWLSRPGSQSSPIKLPARSPKPVPPIAQLPPIQPHARQKPVLSQEDEEMLREVLFMRLTPGVSKSLEFESVRSKVEKQSKMTKSSSHSSNDLGQEPPRRMRVEVPVIDFEMDKPKALDVMDRVDIL